jgi:hypothetical protein
MSVLMAIQASDDRLCDVGDAMRVRQNDAWDLKSETECCGI